MATESRSVPIHRKALFRLRSKTFVWKSNSGPMRMQELRKLKENDEPFRLNEGCREYWQCHTIAELLLAVNIQASQGKALHKQNSELFCFFSSALSLSTRCWAASSSNTTFFCKSARGVETNRSIKKHSEKSLGKNAQRALSTHLCRIFQCKPCRKCHVALQQAYPGGTQHQRSEFSHA